MGAAPMPMPWPHVGSAGIATVVLLTLLLPRPIAAADSLAAASAEIAGCADQGISGVALLLEEPSPDGVKTVNLAIRVEGLPPGAHALHVHETGACTPCSAAGGHFDPGPAGNPSPDGNHPFHAGDLVNLRAGDDGRATLASRSTRFTLSPGPLSLVDADGSALIIHAQPDTFCPGGEVAGCAGGARIACGVIRPQAVAVDSGGPGDQAPPR